MAITTKVPAHSNTRKPMANHSSPPTTECYDRGADEMSLDEYERLGDLRAKSMDQSSSGERFRELPKTHQDQYRRILHELLTFAQGHTIPLCFAPPLVTAAVPLPGGGVLPVKLPMTLGDISGASGCVLRLQSGFFLVTAEHVLRTYEERLQKGERLNWQIGKLPPVNPLSLVVWRDKTEAADRSLMPYRPTDIVLLRLSEQEAQGACGEARIVPTPIEWPPLPLTVGQLIVLAGYPNQLRTEDLEGTMNREACALAFEVTAVADGYCKCQFAYPDLINFGSRAQPPDLNSVNLGGMSGCPAFVLASSKVCATLQYPRLTGVFTHRLGIDPTGDIIEIATFDKVYESDFRATAHSRF